MSLTKAIKSYIWWTYERGSRPYDVMVALIILFIFIAPHFIDFRDKPPAPNAHPIPVSTSVPASK
jgi:hypothetical protein